MTCEMAGEETKRTGLGSLDALHDATNAFASTTATAFQETIHKHAAPMEHPYHDLFLQRQRNACVDIQAANGHVQLRPTMGNLMGDRFVPSAFALTYRRSILRYTAGRLARSVAARRLLRKLPWVQDTPSAIDISTVVFADDLRVVHPVEIKLNSTPALETRRLMDFVVKEAGCLSGELAKEGYAQNMGKAEILPRLHGIGSHLVKRELTSYRAGPGEPKVVLEARHLGPYCHHQYKAHLERERRIAAGRKSAPAAFGLWRSDAAYTTKRSALIAHVVGPLLSAAEAVLYGDSDWAKFDRIVAQYGRRALNGRATTKTLGSNGEILFRSWSNEKVRRYWRLPCTRTEGRVRRLKWLQEVSERPQVHCQVLAALFGDTLHGPTGASNEGRIVGPIGPWACRVVEDLCSLREGVDGGEEFCEDVNGRWLRLFCSTPEAERFRRFDMAEIRAQETTVRIPPPGTRIAHEPHDIDPEPPERTWLCDLNAEHDPLARCGAEFSSYKALAMHKRLAHNLGLFLSRAVSFNSCPNCMSTFASRFSAINHLIRAYTIGHCPRNRSAHSHIAHGVSTALQCRICHEWSMDTRQHQLHVRTHLPNPRPVIKTFRCRKHVVICASHADRRRLGIEHGTWMAARHHHRRWRRVTSRAQQQEAANRRADEHGRSRITKTYGKGQGREGEATPPSHGRSGLGIHRTTHVAGCSTAPNLGGLVAGHFPAANLFSDRHIDETGGTSVPPRGSERVGRPTSRAGPTTRTRISSHGRVTGDSDAGHESRAGPAQPLSSSWKLGSRRRESPEPGKRRSQDSSSESWTKTVRSALRAGLCITGARHMVGTAPPNHHERILARHLNGAQDMEV